MSDPIDQSPTTAIAAPPSDVPAPPDPAPAASATPPAAPAVPRAWIAVGAVLLLLTVGGVAFGASQWAAAQRTSDDAANVDEGRRHDRGVRVPLPDRQRIPFLRGERGLPGHGLVVPGGREITVTAINGSDLTLTASDGWTRTVTVSADTTLRRAGQDITVADLKVGDEVRIRLVRNQDGTFTVTAIEVVLPRVLGQVTATSADTITVERRDGTTMTIRVDAATAYHVRGIETASLGDIAVGMVVLAQGTQNADGSLQALAIYAAGATP